MNGTYLEGISDPAGKKYKNSHNDFTKIMVTALLPKSPKLQE